MVSSVEVEVCALLSYSDWPNEVVGDLRNHARSFIRSSVSDLASRKPFITFSETLQLVSAYKRNKNVSSLF